MISAGKRYPLYLILRIRRIYARAPRLQDLINVTMPVGALDYFRREQMIFYERYNDIIWLVILYGGSLLSGLAWLGQRAIATRRREQLDLLDHLVEIWGRIEKAQTPDELRQILTDLDVLIYENMIMSRDGKLSHRRLAALTLGEARASELIQKRLPAQA